MASGAWGGEDCRGRAGRWSALGDWLQVWPAADTTLAGGPRRPRVPGRAPGCRRLPKFSGSSDDWRRRGSVGTRSVAPQPCRLPTVSSPSSRLEPLPAANHFASEKQTVFAAAPLAPGVDGREAGPGRRTAAETRRPSWNPELREEAGRAALDPPRGTHGALRPGRSRLPRRGRVPAVRPVSV